METTKLESSRVSALQETVDRIHERIGFRRPPFSFEDFFEQYPAFKVFELDLPFGLDGMLFVTPDGVQKTVHLRRDNPRPRLRFTLAHEIIHAQLHFHEGKLCDNMACRTSDRFRDGDRSPEEREADYGAAALLIPLWMLEQYLPQLGSRPYADSKIGELARLFRVSERTMRIQLDLLDGRESADAVQSAELAVHAQL